MPKSNSQQESTPDARIRHQKAGAERRGAGSIAQGKEWAEGPEGNLRELLWDTNLNCRTAKEREKITANTLPAIHRTKGPSKSREGLAGCRPAQPRRRQEAGEGERGRLGPYCAANGPPVFSSLKTSWDSGWSTSAGRVVARHRAHASDLRGQGLGLGPWRGEGARQAPGCLSRWAGEGAKRRCNRVRALVQYRKTGTAHTTGHAPYRPAGSLSRVERENSTPSPCSTTELANLNIDHLRPPVSGGKLRHWRDPQTEAK